jgi:hypothetical protein
MARPAHGPPSRRSGDEMKPYLLAVAVLVVPTLIGVALGRAFRGARRPFRVVGVAVVMAAPVWTPALFPMLPLGSWDLALCGVELAFGVVVALRAPRPWRVLSFTTVVLAVSAGVFELLVLALPEPPSFPPPDAAHFFFIPARMNPVPTALYGHTGAAIVNAADLASDTRPRVLHLGDSMIFGHGVDRADVTTTWLDRLRPDVRNVNLGVSGSGPDVHLLLLRRWVDVVKPSLVVHHLFIGNDVDDIDGDYGVCDGGPLLDYGADGPVARCPELRWNVGFLDRVRLSPPPYPLRVATAFSRAARHLCTGLGQLAGILQSTTVPGLADGDQTRPDQWAHLERILAAERDELDRRGITFVASVLPWRAALTDAAPRSTPAWHVRARMLALLEKLHVTALDAWPVFASCVQERGSAGCFIDPPSWEHHLNAYGHRRYAEWLFTKLSPDSRPAAVARAEGSPTSNLGIPQGRETMVRTLLQPYWGRPTAAFAIEGAAIENAIVRLAVRSFDAPAELLLRRPDDHSQSRPSDRIVEDANVPLTVVIRCPGCDDRQIASLESVGRQVLGNQGSRPDTLWEPITRDGTPQY